MKGSMVLFIAIVVGALAAVLAKTQITSKIDEGRKDWNPELVCVAKVPLREGHVINIKEDIAVVEVPKKLALKGYVLQTAIDTLDGQMVRTEITKGKMIDRYYLGRVAEKGPSSDPSMIDPRQEKRLLTIKVNEVSGIANYLKPRDRVDIMQTDKSRTTRVILQNVTIKHVGRAGDGARGRRTSYSSITVEVSLQEAVLVTNAMSTGEIMLTKRSGLDEDNVKVKPVKPGDYQTVN